eukprot:TRINITY_DN43165_c0_g1_i2.p1 TRINITY_DN43165_c0_g1~~TRINITY_DN43165_c0_g1_i2.p1  ORF type:complete len:510 (-),score=82.75 TRINITY_DN43165_c0_g1_i2:524-2053(-)
MTWDETGESAIRHAVKALRRRHLLEEGAHAPAFNALMRPIVSLSTEWKEKAEDLERELQQCYKAQARFSEQLVAEVAASNASKAQVIEKEAMITDLQNEVAQAREELLQLKQTSDEKIKELELMISENQTLKAQLEHAKGRVKDVESENKMLIDRWMLQKMKDAERLNEANAIYEDMRVQNEARSIEQLALQQVDGVVRQCEAGAESVIESTVPSEYKHNFHAHEGGCGSLLFEYNSSRLFSGGQDQTVRVWDTNTGSLISTLHGLQGSVLDLAVSHDNRSLFAASSSNNLYVWDIGSGQVRHTLTGHTDKVSAVDASKVSSHLVVSAAYDQTMKVWDPKRGYCINTIMSPSNCNTLCISMDGLTLCTGHIDGNLRLWDVQMGRLISEVAAHSHAITSICLSRSGNIVLVSGKGNLHNLFDRRTLEVCGTLRGNGNRPVCNWSRSCISADDNYVAAGYTDGSVCVWSRFRPDIVRTLKGHASPVLSCAWSGLGEPLVSADKNGTVFIWT